MEIVRAPSAWFARLVHVNLLGREKEHFELERFACFIVDYQPVTLRPQ